MIKPVLYRCLVEPDKVEEKTESGLYLSQKTVENLQRAAERGTVLDVGEYFYDKFPESRIKVGCKVHYPKYAGKPVEYKNTDGEVKNYVLLNDEDILAVEDEGDK